MNKTYPKLTYDTLQKMNLTTTEIWTYLAMQELVGRTIKTVRYMTAEEAEEALGWDERPLVLILDNGEYLYPSRDDEGNGPGSLFCSFNGLETLPVLRSTDK